MFNSFFSVKFVGERVTVNFTVVGESRIRGSDGAFSDYVDCQSERRLDQVATGFGNNAHVHLLGKVVV